MLDSSSLNAIRLKREPAPKITGSIATKLSSCGLPVSGDMTPMRINPRGPGEPSFRGKSKKNSVFASPYKRISRRGGANLL